MEQATFAAADSARMKLLLLFTGSLSYAVGVRSKLSTLRGTNWQAVEVHQRFVHTRPCAPQAHTRPLSEPEIGTFILQHKLWSIAFFRLSKENIPGRKYLRQIKCWTAVGYKQGS